MNTQVAKYFGNKPYTAYYFQKLQVAAIEQSIKYLQTAVGGDVFKVQEDGG